VHIGFAGYDEDLLARTFISLASRRPSFLLLTSGTSGDTLARAVSEAGLSQRWMHVGVVPYAELGEILACGDLCLLPYMDRPLNRGRLPNKLADYLASGRPVVANPTGDLAELLREGFGIAAAETPEAMAAAAEELLDRPDLQRQMGTRARTLAEGRLSWPSLAATVEDLYRTLVEARLSGEV
ncbi:MAG TPA: glycosyltransferase, partial [Anaerolineales bacterium]|nr:glycosyltransferase [Anaerolineales bacterium]